MEGFCVHLGPHHVQVTVLRCKHFVVCFFFLINLYIFVSRTVFQKEISECIYWVINLDFPNLIQLGGRRPRVTIALPGCGFVMSVCMCVCVSVREHMCASKPLQLCYTKPDL